MFVISTKLFKIHFIANLFCKRIALILDVEVVKEVHNMSNHMWSWIIFYSLLISLIDYDFTMKAEKVNSKIWDNWLKR